MRQTRRIGPAALLIAVVSLCSCGEDASPAGQDADTGVEDTGPGNEADPLDSFVQALRASAEAFSYRSGEWLDDYGDAPFYGLAFNLRAGLLLDDQAYLDRAREARDYNLSVIDQANDDLLWALDHLEEVFMASLGLVEYAAATGERDFMHRLDALIDTVESTLSAFGDYFEADMGEFAANTYGPTSVTAGVALVLLQYAKLLDTEQVPRRIERAIEIVQEIDEQAFDGQKYRFAPGEDALFLYPNTIMLLVLSRLYEVTGEGQYLSRAEAVFEAIQPLRREGGYYRSPYSAEYMGAQTDDYSTLSSQNYLTLALLLLYENTRNSLYLEHAEAILHFVRTSLYDEVNGRLLHHWIDGRIAGPDDPEVFCSGCNLQFLYVVWYLREVVGA